MCQAVVRVVSFKNQNLCDAKLTYAKFTDVNFTGTDLTKANLSYTDFSGGCTFAGAKISKKNNDVFARLALPSAVEIKVVDDYNAKL